MRDVRLDIYEEPKDIGGRKGLKFIQVEAMEFLKLPWYIGEDVLVAQIGAVKAFSNGRKWGDHRKMRR